MTNTTNAPNSKDWKAWVDTMPGSPPTLHVIGEVEVKGAHLEPKLADRDPQGIIKEILLLDLTIVSTGKPGVQIPVFKPVKYTKTPVEPKQYSEIDIFWEDEIIEKIEKIEKIEIVS